MEPIEFAHIEIEDVWLVVAFPAADFAALSPEEQQLAHAEIRARVACAGFHGSVVTMWQSESGKRFLCEAPQGPFFESIRYDQLHSQRTGILA
ncbi:MAG TPA: hypothetical protein VKS01_05855 [Bryobacteraceae bacterium]|nr:hypothetical protein [Bryobacteraceae bacterium]